MKLAKESIRLLGLNNNEVKVLGALRSGYSTPVQIAEYIRVSRPAIYEILERLHKRRIIKSNIVSGKKYWSQATDRSLEEELYNTKKELLEIKEGVEEVKGLSDSTVIVHRGKEAIQKVLLGMLKEHSSQRIYMLSGNKMVDGWEEYFGPEKINEFNRLVKKNNIITELVLSSDFFSEQLKRFGKQWAVDLEGRTAVAHKIEGEYLENAGQIFIFKNSLYLIAMNEGVVIEIRNSDIQKLILSTFKFIQDSSDKFSINDHLRKLIEE